MNSTHEQLESNLARLARRVAELGFDSIAAHEQAAVLAYSTHNVVTQGGLKRFYEGSIPLTQLVSALRALKLNNLAKAAMASASLFPDPALADDLEARREHLSAMNTDKLDYVFFRLSLEELLDAINAFWRSSQPRSAGMHAGQARG